jgi:hypothetical protein
VHQLWDKLLKIVGDYFPEDLVRFIFPGKKIKICGKFEQERIVLEFQIADINLWILDKGVKKLLNVEPYSVWDDSIPGEVFTRNAIITKSLKHEYEVISVVVLLEKEPHVGKHEVTLGRQVIHQFPFPVVSLKDVDKILKKYPPLAPFVLKVDLSLKEKVIEAVREHKILRYITVLILNRLGIDQKEALAMVGLKLEEFKQALLEVPIMQDVAKEWEERGEERGKKAIARSMLKEGLTIALIAKLTGLNPDEIANLKQE